MTFGEALEQLEMGSRVARSGWSGKDMFVTLISASEWAIMNNDSLDLMSLDRAPFIAMKTTDDKIVPWFASQSDILADDWLIVL